MFTTKMQLQRNWVWDIFILIAVIGIFYSIWMGIYPLFTPDEARYSEIAREMTVTGDYITPRMNGIVYLDKPIFYYWLQASAIHLFGLKEWALRFWPALFGVFGCLMCYGTGRALFNRRSGIISAFMLATSPLYYGISHYANLDLEVGVLISTSLLFSVLALTQHRNRTILFIFAYIFAGLAFLTKGLIGIMFPFMIIGAWILFTNRWYIIREMRVLVGIGIIAAINLPWYSLVQKANPQFLHYFFVTQQFSRYLSLDAFNNKSPLWFYIPIITLGFFPWSVFSLQALYASCKKTLSAWKENSSRLFLILWFLIVFIFFSTPQSKTIGYIIPVLPPLALLVGNYVDEILRTGKTTAYNAGKILFIMSCVLISIGCFAAPHILAVEIRQEIVPYLYLTGTLFLISGSITCLLWKKSETLTVFTFFCTAAAFLLIMISSAAAINHKTIKPLAVNLQNVIKPGDEITSYYKYYYDLPLYLQRKITVVADWNAPDIIKNDNWVRELWYGMPYQKNQDWLINDSAFWQRWNSDKKIYVFLNKNYFTDFSHKANSKPHILYDHQDVMVVSNVDLAKAAQSTYSK